ncbi:DNA gyrase inhibitor YacG [Ponticaulis sp.]|uniref:DNA gyrase inhibitor YacG n=1 Tax=Ponticaulis sp. TaxID=2020902 RepID=UPI000B680E38|nr:DNA gyrase inhibitor YacG [Ponticaulis sp.]MAI91551.1 DNA gyrase inhibitor YacG [Ponticaulis sp.]OUX97506.1 MAG: DNA gyrase inhibitor YacG [Hyphomonadaceae bacterium TMED5]|tara:strand:+ start:8071 stop:8265 length:195 start_codon:yes stop_codon:yes gene_type:complete
MNQSILCPICEKRKPEAEFKPFCSKRCADVDLSRWLSDGYVISGSESEDADDTPSGDPVQRGDD